MRTIEEHPAVQSAKSRLGQLRRRKAELESEFEAARFGNPEPTVEELADRAFAGETATATETRSASAVQRDLRATELAITRAKNELGSAKATAETELLESIESEYAREIRRVAKAVRSLLAAAGGERAIRERVREAGVNPILRPRRFHPLPEGELRSWLDRAERQFGA